jgi:hypothetical protein
MPGWQRKLPKNYTKVGKRQPSWSSARKQLRGGYIQRSSVEEVSHPARDCFAEKKAARRDTNEVSLPFSTKVFLDIKGEVNFLSLFFIAWVSGLANGYRRVAVSRKAAGYW